MKNNYENSKISIYQVLPRLLCNKKRKNVYKGTLQDNGSGKMNDITTPLLKKIQKFGFTHIWYTGLLEHATCTDYSKYGIKPDFPEIVKGQAGSPYAIKDYYDIDPDLAEDPARRKEEFRALVARTHDVGLKLIMDFVPNHVARIYHSDAKPQGVYDFGEDDDIKKSFDRNNNFYYFPSNELDLSNIISQKTSYREYPAKATGNDAFTNRPSVNDWYETVKLNYGVDYLCGKTRHFSNEMNLSDIPNTWKKMLDILRYWANEGVDAFRCDMAEMVPIEFWHFVIGTLKKEFPHLLFIAEIYNPSLYHDFIHWGKFDYLYDKVGLYDTLRGVMRNERPASDITYCWQSTNDIQHQMLHFLENHDEQRIASDFFCQDAQKGIPAFAVATLLNQSPIMLYFGQEMGERGMNEEGFSGRDGRTTIFDYWEAPKSLVNAELTDLALDYQRILKLITLPQIAKGEMFDLMYVNDGSKYRFNPFYHFAFIRSYKNKHLLIIANFADESAEVDVVIPEHAFKYLNLKQGTNHFTDLFTGTEFEASLQFDGCLTIQLPRLGCRVLEFIA